MIIAQLQSPRFSMGTGGFAGCLCLFKIIGQVKGFILAAAISFVR